MRITIQNEEKYVWGHNVIGEIKGSDFPEEIIVICGHYDTHWQCPGATDNGGGTVIAMELARLLAKKESVETYLASTQDVEPIAVGKTARQQGGKESSL